MNNRVIAVIAVIARDRKKTFVSTRQSIFNAFKSCALGTETRLIAEC